MRNYGDAPLGAEADHGGYLFLVRGTNHGRRRALEYLAPVFTIRRDVIRLYKNALLSHELQQGRTKFPNNHRRGHIAPPSEPCSYFKYEKVMTVT
jgi:hypothetical protein